MGVDDTKSNNDKKNNDTDDKNSREGNFILLEITESLQQEQILTTFAINNKTGCIVASLNHVYNKKTIVSNIYRDWIKTLDVFASRAEEKGVSNEHIVMLKDALDDNNEKVMQCYYSQIKEESNGSDRTAVALELVKSKIVDIFLDEVKAP